MIHLFIYSENNIRAEGARSISDNLTNLPASITSFTL